jgi:hypothetical protein
MKNMKIDSAAKDLISQIKAKLIGRSKDKNRKQKVANPGNSNESFWRRIHDNQPLAFEDDLCKGWEYGLTRLLQLFFPNFIEKETIALSKDVAAIENRKNIQAIRTKRVFRKWDIESGRWQDQPSEQISPQDGDMLRFEQSLVNYHSVRVWYHKVKRKVTSNAITAVYLSLYILLCIAMMAFSQVILFADEYFASRGPSVAYTVPSSGDHYIELRNLTTADLEYTLNVVAIDNEIVMPDFAQVKIWPLRYGQRVFSEIPYEEEALFSVATGKGDTLRVSPYPWYANFDIDIILFDSQMKKCGEVNLWEENMDIRNPFLECEVESEGNYFIQVRNRRLERASSSVYGFAVNNILDVASTTSNHIFENSTEIPRGALIIGHLAADTANWYYFTAIAGQRLEIRTSVVGDLSNPSLALYQHTDNGLQLADFTTRPLPANALFWREKEFETTRGKAYFFSDMLRSVNIQTTPQKAVFLLMIGLSFGFIFVCVALVRLIGWLLRSPPSSNTYDDSAIVRYMVDVLLRLENDNVLRSQSARIFIQKKIMATAELAYDLYKTSRFLKQNANPVETRKHFSRISSQIAQTAIVISVPQEDTVPCLRQRFVEWLDVFLKGEYGEFKFSEDFHPTSTPWYRPVASYIQQNWKRILVGLVAILGLVLASHPLWSDYLPTVMRWAWLAIRFIVLIVAVYAIYNKWGASGPNKEQESKWQNMLYTINGEPVDQTRNKSPSGRTLFV